MNNIYQPEKRKPRLLDLVSQKIQTLHYSRRTEKTYIGWIKRFILFHGKRHPVKMGEKEINRFLSYLAIKKQVTASTQNQALCAIVFLYRQVLNKDIGLLEGLIRAKRPGRLPVVLTKAEVKQVFRNLTGIKRMIVMIMYGSGLRLMECLRLRIKDIDFLSNQIIIRDGKKNKDRITMLPGVIKVLLKEHLKRVWKIHQLDIKDGFGMFICLMLFHGNILMLQENGIGSMYFLHPNDLETQILVNKVGIISMKQPSRNL